MKAPMRTAEPVAREARATVEAASVELERPRIGGKQFYVGGQPFWVRGVTYGPFRPDEQGSEYGDNARVELDFRRMAAKGINTVRTYTPPPRWLLDTAQRHGLRVLVGVPWEQHTGFLDRRETRDSIERRVRETVRACGNHPALLAFALGNEIPAGMVRWYGERRVAAFLKRLYLAAKEEDPEALVTYVNYPTTEYLRLPFLDFVSFNVYLEDREELAGYLARLQNLADDRPLLMAEVGLDSQRNGMAEQAAVLQWQIRTAFAAGCAGLCVFAWTDEWHRGGADIEDWDFGLTTRARTAKPALETVRQAFSQVPFSADTPWPRVSVVVCTYNGSRTIRETCDALTHLEYPNYEVIIVNDGSTDGTLDIVSGYGFRVIDVPNGGLSRARNLGYQAATGEIIAYLDDDAYPTSHWLQYLAWTFLTTDHAGVGGPNLAPAGDGLVAECVSNSPGGPNHVLLSDRVAEHIPGCNMAFRKSALEAIAGFDAQFRIAGDDVDLCWQLQEQGWTLGFSPAAVVWHHRRNQVRTYLKQQYNYGRAEAMLEAKWPEKYNGLGHALWQGRLYGGGMTLPLIQLNRIYHGIWGSQPFQQMYTPPLSLLQALPLTPEWYLLIALLGAISVLGLVWPTLWLFVPATALAIGVIVAQATVSAAAAPLRGGPTIDRLKHRALILALHLWQPVVRLRGRLKQRVNPWRRRGSGLASPMPHLHTLKPAEWSAPETLLERLGTGLRASGSRVVCAGPYDRWDLGVRGGLFGGQLVLVAVEEHGHAKQFVRIRSWPVCSRSATALTILVLLAASLLAAVQPPAGAVLGVVGLGLIARMVIDCATAAGTLRRAVSQIVRELGTG